MDPVIHAMHLRAGRWYRYENTCHGKVDFKSEASGARAARRLTKQLKRFLDTYPCRFCDGWHLRHRLPLAEVLYFSMPEPPPVFTTKALNCPACRRAPRSRYRNLPYAHSFDVPQWPGDLYICWDCAHVYAVNEDLDLVALTEQQLQQLIEEVHDEQRRRHQGSGIRSGGDGPTSTS